MNSFITNEKTRTLKKRLLELIEHSQELKFLVGFFYFSGIHELYEGLKTRGNNIEIKVLVGLHAENIISELVEYRNNDSKASNEEKVEAYFASLAGTLNTDTFDIEDFYKQVDFFVSMIKKEKLVIRQTNEPNHAKLYIFKIKDALKGLADSKFITGSSNLTKAGLRSQKEFNVEIGDYGTEEAEGFFDALWETGVQLTEDEENRKRLLELIENKTQTTKVTPFEAYALILKTYIETQMQKHIKPHTARLLERAGYKKYRYQLDAVEQALTILEEYNGVIIADVVGLGKSIIASLIASNTRKRGLIICPPGLIGDKNANSGWKKYAKDFELYDWEIRSSGDLESVCEYVNENPGEFEIVIVDEVHRFRNQDTADYEYLSIICRNKLVVLLSATPFNNSPGDIFSLLKLFIVPNKSKITIDENLESKFSIYDSLFRRISFIAKNHNSPDPEKRQRAENYFNSLFGYLPVDLAAVKKRASYLSREIRNVISPVLLRRNRIDLKNDPDYSKEVANLSEANDPEELFFELSHEQSLFYDKVIDKYFGEDGLFKGAVYQPYNYEKEHVKEEKRDEAGNRAFQQQRNLYDFMRRLLVKRFESSFGAFVRSIDNFERITSVVLDFINKTGKYILDRQLLEKIYEYDIDEIEEELIKFTEKLEEKNAPKNNRIYLQRDFYYKNEFIADIESDLALFGEIKKQLKQLDLVNEDPKATKLIEELKKTLSANPEKGEPPRKVIIFSEYVDTVKHLKPLLKNIFPDIVLTIDGVLGVEKVNQLLSNFDASAKKQTDEFQILLTSDKISEGFNLNRAGTIINYDIPWNPTCVIQRLGRINRIGKKLFSKLNICNFFPTESGSDIIKSRQIASQKMFLIHNTLGEDSKIFDIDETPTAASLFSKVNSNPDKDGQESTLTAARKQYEGIKVKYPKVISRIKELPLRVKTTKSAEEYQLCVFRRKGLGLYVHTLKDDIKIQEILFDESLESIQCEFGTSRLELSNSFWKNYELIKAFKDTHKISKSDVSLEVKAMNNLQSALRGFKSELKELLPFIRVLISDLREYKSLSTFTVRRIASSVLENNQKSIDNFKKEIVYIRRNLGDDYLEIIKSRIGNLNSEVIIAVENQY